MQKLELNFEYGLVDILRDNQESRIWVPHLQDCRVAVFAVLQREIQYCRSIVFDFEAKTYIINGDIYRLPEQDYIALVIYKAIGYEPI